MMAAPKIMSLILLCWLMTEVDASGMVIEVEPF